MLAESPFGYDIVQAMGLQSRTRWRELGWALLYILPALVFLVGFTYLPFLKSLWYSFFIIDRNTFEPVKFYGLTYYGRIFNLGDAGQGPDWINSILITLKFSLMVVPPLIVAAVFLAALSSGKIKGIKLFRSIFTISLAVSLASAGIIWSLLFSPAANLTGWLINLAGIKSPTLLNDSGWALPCVAFMTVWTSLGFNYLIALTGIQAIPSELHESCSIDGGNRWQAFRHVTLPLLGPSLIFLLVIDTIACFQAFTQFKVMIDSVGPDRSTDVFVYAIFNTFWVENNYGLASAMSIILFAILLGLSFLQLRLDKRVHYQ